MALDLIFYPSQEANSFTIPTAMNNLIRKKCVFYLKLTKKNTVDGKEKYKVMKVTHLKNNENFLPAQQVEKQVSNNTICVDLFQSEEEASGETEQLNENANTMQQRKELDVLKVQDINKTKKMKEICDLDSQI